MQAVVCEGFGGSEMLALRELPDPPPPGPGEVQVRLLARGVQYVDVLMLAGKYQFRPEPPFVPGSEGAGESRRGRARRHPVHHRRSGDEPAAARRLRASWANAKAADCDPIPAGLSLDEAAVFRGAYGTAYHALLQRGRLKAGDRVLIHGAAGGIGLPAIQIAKLHGADVIADRQHRRETRGLPRRGRRSRDRLSWRFRDKVMELTQGRGVDIIYDPVNGPTFEESLRCLAWGGRILILGFLGGAPALGPHQLPVDQGDRGDRRAHRRAQRETTRRSPPPTPRRCSTSPRKASSSRGSGAAFRSSGGRGGAGPDRPRGHRQGGARRLRRACSAAIQRSGAPDRDCPISPPAASSDVSLRRFAGHAARRSANERMPR